MASPINAFGDKFIAQPFINIYYYMEEEEQQQIQQEFRALLDDYLNSSHRKKVEIIEKAFNFAHQAHQGARRRSGEPYIMHPLAVARIVAKEIGLGSTSICSALLHDVVEDTDYTVEDIENLFGKKIASIVDGLTKISGGVFADKANENEQAENFRRLLLTMSDDIRVVLIKIADRLHNMRTLSSMPPHKQSKIAGETQYIYAPLANRLGLFNIKTELEDLSFHYVNPQIYTEIEHKLIDSQEERSALFEAFSIPIKERLKADLNYKFEITARIKSVFSIWNKMQTKQIPFDEVYDILALRIVFENDGMTMFEEKEACWRIYTEITTLYRPHPERTRDWISTPKANGYEALHVTVMGPKGRWIEVQIRSRRMNEIAEKGYAAHWKYKEGSIEEKESELENWLKTIKDLLENPEPNAIDFLDTFKLNLFTSEIFVFTPKGDIKTLPQHATALDFAFFLHSDLGMRCIGAKVNHKLVPLNYELKSGDQVEILTSKKQRPQPEWINYVNTAHGKTRIKSIFKKENSNFIRKGKKEIEETLQDVDMVFDSENLDKILRTLKIKEKEDLFYKVGKGKITSEDIKKVFKTKSKNKWVNYLTLQFLIPNKKNDENELKKVDNTSKLIQLTDNEAGRIYKIADCCNPIPGDDVVGFKNNDGTIIVHKQHCPTSTKLKASAGEKIISAEWVTHKLLSFPAGVEIECIDNVGVLIKVLKVFSQDHSINIYKVQTESTGGIFKGKIYFYIHDVEEMNNLCMNILKVSEVKSVKRLEE